MPVPKSVVKINKKGVQYTSSVDRAQYTIRELTRAALRDVGKFICRKFRDSYYSHFSRKRGRVGKYTQYWVKYKQKQLELQVGLKPFAFYGGFQELGSSKTTRLGLLSNAAENNIAEIVKIESKYLSALEDEAEALSLISEDDYEGGADG
ncbi:hypothetical protein I5677_12110 [Mobilitalea sibirica]|uniref:Uncharacterized protein n=1 Tax=Mobilitalea sibirica TaxID=1462919 RepID=A0A8J7KXC6_9FIRM|nr:hypothetical protein [Mobilitalea sibirica]MBH1941637.1 hypothetical protein [Mobilitalea sibirica]